MERPALATRLGRLRHHSRQQLLFLELLGEISLGAFYARVHLHVERFARSEEHTSELQSRLHLVCRLLLEKKTKTGAQSSTSYSIYHAACRALCDLKYSAESCS